MRSTCAIALLAQGTLSLPVAERRSGRAVADRLRDVPYPEAAYNPLAAEEFYRKRPIESAARLAKIVTRSLGFVADTAMDSRLGREDEMADRRGDELLELVSDLGVSLWLNSDESKENILYSIPFNSRTGSQPSSKVR